MNIGGGIAFVSTEKKTAFVSTKKRSSLHQNNKVEMSEHRGGIAFVSTKKNSFRVNQKNDLRFTIIID